MRRLTALLVPLAIASCSAPPPKPAPAPPPPPPAPAASEACLDITRIREAKVVNDRIIDFHLNDGRSVRSTMTAACAGLMQEKAFTYSTTLTKMCPGTPINVVNQAGGPRLGAACTLGPFAPIAPTP